MARRSNYAFNKSKLKRVDSPQKAFKQFLDIARRNNISKFNEWLAFGYDVNMNNYGMTALHIAAYFRRETMIKMLLANGASPFVVNDAGHTPADFVSDSARLKNLFERHKQP